MQRHNGYVDVCHISLLLLSSLLWMNTIILFPALARTSSLLIGRSDVSRHHGSTVCVSEAKRLPVFFAEVPWESAGSFHATPSRPQGVGGSCTSGFWGLLTSVQNEWGSGCVRPPGQPMRYLGFKASKQNLRGSPHILAKNS